MDRPRIALINASHDGQRTRRNFRRELPATLTEYDATAGELPDTHDFDAVVVTGSRASVYWDEAWIEATREWVAGAVEAGLPALGICWGHQLLADVTGGEVASMGEYELGYRTVERTADSDLFAGVDEEFTAFTTHSDEVVELPPGAEVLAENDYSIQSFRKGDVFGVQFHPEYDTKTAREVIRGKDLPDERIRSVLDGITDDAYAEAQNAKRVFDNFVSRVHERQVAAD